MITLPRFYPILDTTCFENADALFDAAEEMVEAGATILQYRNKSGDARQMLDEAKELRRRLNATADLIMNDRADICIASGFQGVHLGQEDLPPAQARKIIGANLWLGLSAHNPEQVTQADETSANYIAIGPVFSTSSKANPDPVVGPDGVRNARGRTRKPLVAIGGITRANCLSVIDAGADSVAVISDLLPHPGKSVEEFLRLLS